MSASPGGVGRQEGTSATSKRVARGALYDAVTRLAGPGDVAFFITQVRQAPPPSRLRRLYRRWLGLLDADTDLWHTAIYAGAVKERRGRQVRPHIIHARAGGVVEEHLPPSFFASVHSTVGMVLHAGRVEILRYRTLTAAQRHTIMAHSRAQVGKGFADLGWRHDLFTYALGLPSRRLDQARVSCHGLAYAAYDRAGIAFPHALHDAPITNLARYLGHPLGHPARQALPERLYLRDHHFYRDNRFTCLLAAFEHPETGALTVVENPGKYSWDPRLQDEYTRRYGVDCAPALIATTSSE